MFNNIAIFLHRVLRQHATSAKSYIQDTSDFLRKIQDMSIPEDAILAFFDMVSLYTFSYILDLLNKVISSF